MMAPYSMHPSWRFRRNIFRLTVCLGKIAGNQTVTPAGAWRCKYEISWRSAPCFCWDVGARPAYIRSDTRSMSRRLPKRLPYSGPTTRLKKVDLFSRRSQAIGLDSAETKAQYFFKSGNGNCGHRQMSLSIRRSIHTASISQTIKRSAWIWWAIPAANIWSLCRP